MDKTQKGYLILLFLVSPFLGAIKLFKIKEEKTLTFFGTLFFGLIGSVFVYVKGTDGHSHLMNAKAQYLNMSLNEFLTKAYDAITFSAAKGAADIYIHTLSYLSASLLQSPTLIHVFAGFILGYFFTKSVLLVLKGQLKTEKKYILIGLITLFVLIKSIEALNSVRMWTGMWVLFYGTYSYAQTKQKKYFFVILISVFIHFAYAVILIPVIVAFVMKKQSKIVVALYILSFITTSNFSFIEKYIPKSDLLVKRQSTYVIDSKDKIKRFKKDNVNYQNDLASSNFYKNYGQSSYLNFSVVGLSIILCFFYLKKQSDSNINFLVSTGILLYTFANLVAFSPELQGRTQIIAATFILAAAIHLQFTVKDYLLSQKTKRILNIGFVLFLISAIPIFLLQISDIMFNISFFILLFPQISWFLGDNDHSIRGIIGLLID